MKIRNRLDYFFAWVLALSMVSLNAGAISIQLKMLSHGSALLVVDDTKHFLHEGEKTQEGVTLISANPQFAMIEYQGEKKKMELSRNISTQFQRAEKNEVRIASGFGNHYRIKGYVNELPINFVVDTGATYISLSAKFADDLHIDYRGGKVLSMSTANGVAQAFYVVLDKVRIGTLVIHQVPAVIQPDLAMDALLGNSFLSKVNMKIDSGVLVLTEK